MSLRGSTSAVALVYFERYNEAAQAFDKAFTIGLPQRMTRYQFWPFFAYYNAGRIDYLLQITENTYKSISGEYSEEALLWHGYGLLSKGDTTGALADWNKALKVHPNYCDAETSHQYLYSTDLQLNQSALQSVIHLCFLKTISARPGLYEIR